MTIKNSMIALELKTIFKAIAYFAAPLVEINNHTGY